MPNLRSYAAMLQNKLTLPSHYIRGHSERTFFPHYVGLQFHANDRQKGTISTFFALGISVYFDRVMDNKRELTLSVSMWLVALVFTTGEVNNIDESTLSSMTLSLTNMWVSGVPDEAWPNHIHNAIAKKYQNLMKHSPMANVKKMSGQGPQLEFSPSSIKRSQH